MVTFTINIPPLCCHIYHTWIPWVMEWMTVNHFFHGKLVCYPSVQREHYIRILVADGQGPSNSYWEGPMYVSICVQLFGQGSLNFLAIS